MDTSLKDKRVLLLHMDDIQAPPPGSNGTITHVDDMGMIHVKWDNGSTLAIDPVLDQYQIFE